MDTITSFLFILTGLLLRLAIPIAITTLLIILLRKLDAYWQAESQLPELAVQKLECWKIKSCPPEQRKDCVAGSSSLPCWQVRRLPNGYLREECLTCSVFRDAPLPSLRIQPRRM
jgi:hypothetical protein